MRRLPVWIAVPAALGTLLVVVPLLALVIRAPWSRMGSLLHTAAVAEPLVLSLATASTSTVLCLVLGVPLAWLLARRRRVGVLRAVVTVPLVVPPVVAGVALLLAFGSNGVLGGQLAALGIRLPFTTAAVVLAQTFVALPFLVLAVEGGLRGFDERYEEVVSVHGASGWFVFRHVTLPLLRPALAAGAALAWARSIGEFGATVTFAGTSRTTLTMPSAVYTALDADPKAAVALSLVLVVVSLLVLVALRGRWLPGVRR
ncbi:MAG: molybdate transporter, inner rane subunit [Frankiales bacterium]|nr:molybdate transporter, inner rane subunit [Frankiales bacterium]